MATKRSKARDKVLPGPAAVSEPDNQLNAYQTATACGAPAEFRFSNARSVREIFERLRQHDLKAADRRARIKRSYNGSRPYDPRKLAAAGLKHRANVTTMGLKGQLDARVGVVQDMALDTTDLVELRPIAGNMAGPEAERIAEVVTREFSTTLRDSPRFLNAITSLVKETDLYGIGPLTWPDYKDYEPIALECGQVKYLEDASPISTENELYMLESPLSASYLFRLIQDEDSRKVAVEEGWNIAAVRELIYTQFVSGTAPEYEVGDFTQTSLVESAVAMWRQSRFYDDGQFQSAHVIHVYAKEVSGAQRITHYITATTGDSNEFIMRKPEAYETMDQCMIWLTYTAGERYAREVRGLASYLLPMEDVSNRLLCRTLDAAMLAAGLILTGGDAARRQRLTVFEHGPYTVLPADVAPAQSQVQPKFNELAAVREMALNTAFNNATGARGPAAVSEKVYSGADRKTKDQIRQEASAGDKTEKSLFVLRSVTFDMVFKECFRRFMILVRDPAEHDNFPAVGKFIERCKRQFVAMKDLKTIEDDFTMYMCRDLVTGGADAKGNSLEGILSVAAGNLDERGVLNVTHDLVECRLGKRAAERYRPLVSRDKMPSDAASFAQVENNEMEELNTVLVASDQLHWAHITIHGQLIQKIIERVQQGQIEDPQRMLDIIKRGSDHIREHLSYGRKQTGMEPKAKQVEGGLKSLMPFIKMLTMQAAAVQKHQDSQARQQQKEQEALEARADGKDNAVKMHKIDTDAALKMREQTLNQEVKMVGVQNTAEAEAVRERNRAQLATISDNAKRLIEAGSITGNQPPNPGAISGNQPLTPQRTTL